MASTMRSYGSWARSLAVRTTSADGPSKRQKHFSSPGMNVERRYWTGVPSCVIAAVVRLALPAAAAS